MLKIGLAYRFTWADGDGECYEYRTVTQAEGTVISAAGDDGDVSTFNMAAPTFIRADPCHTIGTEPGVIILPAKEAD